MKSILLSSNHIYKSPWNGYDIQDQYAPLHEGYLFNILGVIQSAMRQYPKVLVIRFDLRLPVGFDETDTAVISRFFDSLNSQIREDYLRHVARGNYVLSFRPRHLWSKERGLGNDGLHYHVAILLPYKRFCSLGNFNYEGEPDLTEAQKNMAWRIRNESPPVC
ncbi:YagK/YfjJ domain-containing protein [Alcanivorax sp.]|uniref:YagK/YfjJ domain-containing protein n=1 Tax=Alcanivorax sp. TaxID=1872427 RepID=UPI002B2671EB|nr:inovirus-type Gp2 protein [Alcanivorax sp.]